MKREEIYDSIRSLLYDLYADDDIQEDLKERILESIKQIDSSSAYKVKDFISNPKGDNLPKVLGISDSKAEDLEALVRGHMEKTNKVISFMRALRSCKTISEVLFVGFKAGQLSESQKNQTINPANIMEMIMGMQDGSQEIAPGVKVIKQTITGPSGNMIPNIPGIHQIHNDENSIIQNNLDESDFDSDEHEKMSRLMIKMTTKGEA